MAEESETHDSADCSSVSAVHDTGLLTLEVTDLNAAATLDELVEGDDPFAVLSE